MARTAIAPVRPKGPFPGTVGANALDVTLTAGDATNDNSFILNGPALLIMRNSGAGARTVDIHAVPIQGRDGDITTYSIGAGQFAALRVQPHGWRQSDGTLHVDPEHAEVQMALLEL